MKLALINPKGITLNINRVFALNNQPSALTDYNFLMSVFNMWSGINLGLLIIASLTPDSFEIELIDENYQEINFNKHYDLVAITGITQQIKRAYEIADDFREKGKTVVLGGIHATLMPDEAKKHSDSVIVGECENIWPIFIKDFLSNTVKSFYKNDTTINLKEAITPCYDLIKGEYYKTIWIQTTRGCPRDCIFCAASKIFGKKYRHKRIDKLIEEIGLIKKLFNKEIGFADDNMFIDRKFSVQLVKELIPLKIKWFAQTDISIAEDENLIYLLRESGCKMLFIGFESLSRDNLKGIDRIEWKLRYLKKYKEYIKKIQSFGIGVMGAFIFGFDNDDVSIFEKTANFVIDNNLFASQFTILTPLPGTKLRAKLEKENRITSNDWDKYTFLDVNFRPNKMSIEELYKGTIQTYRKIYSKEVRLKVAKYFKNIFYELYKT